MITPKSISKHLVLSAPEWWSVLSSEFEWSQIDPDKGCAISGSAFIDKNDPYGKLGNPFAVVIGKVVKDMSLVKCCNIAQETTTPETVFVRSVSQSSQSEYKVLVTVLTPVHKELGACAHGFIGAVQVLLNTGYINPDSTVTLNTTCNTSARITISSNQVILITFSAQKEQEIMISSKAMNNIFGTRVLTGDQTVVVGSVGSPKLILEVEPDIFSQVQLRLSALDYNELLAFQDNNHVNGIHLFSRNKRTNLPEKAIQVNAYLGKENVVDRATGVSAAAQVVLDDCVNVGQETGITQYTQSGPSAKLSVTKLTNHTVSVGGSAVLFNYKTID